MSAPAKVVETTGERGMYAGIEWPHGMQTMALRALGELALNVRADGTWYVNLPHVEIKNGAMLTTPTQTAPSPQKAIAEAWNTYSTGLVIVQHPGQPRRALRWNGFMWADVVEGGR